MIGSGAHYWCGIFSLVRDKQAISAESLSTTIFHLFLAIFNGQSKHLLYLQSNKLLKKIAYMIKLFKSDINFFV